MIKMFTPRCLGTFFLVLFSTVLAANEDQYNGWPREITVDEGTVVIYQPQPEKLEGNILTGRAAIAVELKDNKDPIFGAVWFSANLEVDRSDRSAVLTNMEVSNIRIPLEDETKAKQLVTLIEKEVPLWELPIALDDLLATMEVLEARSAVAENLNVKPPVILLTEQPTILIVIDGEPELRDVDGSSVKRVINTPYTLLNNSADKRWYLYADKDTWYSAGEIKGDWQLTKKVPAEVAAMAPPPAENDEQAGDGDKSSVGVTPKIVVATEPTELISMDGKPEFTPVEGTQLLFVENTESDLLMDIAGQRYYLLLAGRWYSSAELDDSWSYVKGEDLPDDFRAIPEQSDISTVLYAVPGTKVAEEAVLDAQIPQTAAVERSKASLKVEYDGEPKFEPIKGTDLRYAVNTPAAVILADKRYYTVDDGVWFVADKATGAWEAATLIPAAIYSIPPDSPLYHVTFVRIYKVTPEYVYVGYTPGYTNTYVYHGTVVYGTGYYYPGWYGHYYYPRYSTWGFHARYSPWGGWRFGFSYSTGPFTFVVGGGSWYRGGWWGPVPYRGYSHGYRHGYNNGYRRGYRNGYAAGYTAGRYRSNNIYNNSRNLARTRPTSARLPGQSRARVAKSRPNNVYTDRSGNVYRDRGDGWDKRSKDGWKNNDAKRPANASRPGTKPTNKPASRPTTKPATKPASRPTTMPTSRPASRPSSSSRPSSTNRDLNRARSSRARGNQRSRNVSRSRSGGRR